MWKAAIAALKTVVDGSNFWLLLHPFLQVFTATLSERRKKACSKAGFFSLAG